MSHLRGARPAATIAPRFRCQVCRVFVTGGPDGACPRCGWQPPSVAVPAPPRTIVVPAWAVAAAVAAVAALGVVVAKMAV